MKKLAYIGGYGRSGSTLLEALLTLSSPAVLGCGEIVNITTRSHCAGNTCSCGEPPEACRIWAPVVGSKSDWTHQDVALSLLQQAPDSYSAVIDSSKTAWGCVAAPLRLRRVLGDDFYLIHLVRNPVPVSWSTIKRLQRVGAQRIDPSWRCVRSALGWWIANLSCEYFRILYPKQYLRVSYETLVRDPIAVTRNIFEFLQVSQISQPGNIEASGNRHQLFGNRARHRHLTLADVQDDSAWKTEMPAIYQKLVAITTFPLRLRYGL